MASTLRASVLGCVAGASALAAAAPLWMPPASAWRAIAKAAPEKKTTNGLNLSGNRNPGSRDIATLRPNQKPVVIGTPPPGTKVAGSDPAQPGPTSTTPTAKPEEAAPKSKPAAQLWIENNILRRVTLAGQRRLGFHMQSVDGDQEAYNSLNYYGKGGQRFTDTGTMNVSGRNVLGFLTFDLAYTDTQYDDPDSQRVTLSYQRGPYGISTGDIRGTLLNTNPFAMFSRSLRGTQAEFKQGRTNFRAVYSEEKGTARTVTIAGTNSAGPYYLQSGRIIPDSIEVQVDGQPMKLGEDYVVNSDIGAITFLNRIISPTSTIVATYESYNIGVGGTLQGAGLTYDFGRFGRIGFTGLEQRTGLNAANDAIVQRFYGFGSAAAQYWLDYEPDLTRPFRVKVDGIEQIRYTDWNFDPSTNYVITFTRPIATTQQIDVIYYVKNANLAEGDRRVWGFDYRLPVGKRGFIQYAQATGGYTDSDQKGTARGISGQYNLGNLTLKGNVRDVPRDYVTVQSVGFQRNERSSEVGLDYRAGRTTFSANSKNSLVSTTSTDGVRNDRITRTGGTVTYADPGGTSYQLGYSRARNRRDSESRLDTTSFTGARRFGRLETNFGFEYQDGFGLISDGTTNQEGSVNLQTFRLGAKYRLNDALAFDARGSVSKVRALDETGNGTDFSLGAVYRPGDRFSLTANYADSDSGQLSTLGSAFGDSGYGGNGFTGGALGSGAFTTGTTRYRTASLLSDWQVSPKISLDAHAVRSENSGALSSNSRSFTYGLGLGFDLGNFNNLSVNFDRTTTDFLQLEGLTSSTTALDFSLNGAPRGPWTYRLGATSFLAGSGLYDNGQDSFGFDMMLGYRLNPRQRVFVQYRNGRTSGTYGQAETSLGAFYEYRIWANLGLVGSYKFRNVANLTDIQGGAYRSSGFDLELVFDFGRF